MKEDFWRKILSRKFVWIVHVWYIKVLTRLLGFREKISNFSRLHCLAIPRRDLSTKKTRPNIEWIWAESLRVMLKCYDIKRGLPYWDKGFSPHSKVIIYINDSRVLLSSSAFFPLSDVALHSTIWTLGTSYFCGCLTCHMELLHKLACKIIWTPNPKHSNYLTNHILEELPATDAKCGETARANNSPIFFGQLLIGWERGTRLFGQSYLEGVACNWGAQISNELF